jgi:enamine deaminase RidA (YjgF/YER057c/UK114 family)
MTIQRFDTNERSSQAVAHGNLVFLAGQVARDNPGASITDQTREVLSRIDGLLARAGTSKASLVNATIWLRRASDYVAMNDVWVAWLPKESGPARAVIEATMITEGWDVEIAVIAARD